VLINPARNPSIFRRRFPIRLWYPSQHLLRQNPLPRSQFGSRRRFPRAASQRQTVVRLACRGQRRRGSGHPRSTLVWRVPWRVSPRYHAWCEHLAHKVRYVTSRSEFMNGRRQKAPLLRYTVVASSAVPLSCRPSDSNRFIRIEGGRPTRYRHKNGTWV